MRDENICLTRGGNVFPRVRRRGKWAEEASSLRRWGGGFDVADPSRDAEGRKGGSRATMGRKEV